MNDNYNEHTLSIYENFKVNWQCYVGIWTAFTSTLTTFPVLMFRLDFYLPLYIQYAYITFIFNLGDTVSRYVFDCYKIVNMPCLHIANLVKIGLVYLNYISIGSASPYLNNHASRFFIVFSQAFLNGYLLMGYLEVSTNAFKSIFDRNRTGLLNSFSLQFGLTVGALVSLAW